MSSSTVHINDVVITPQLLSRGYRSRDASLEKLAFQDLAMQLSYGTQALLNALC